jgi:hypothetical protein
MRISEGRRWRAVTTAPTPSGRRPGRQHAIVPIPGDVIGNGFWHRAERKPQFGLRPDRIEPAVLNLVAHIAHRREAQQHGTASQPGDAPMHNLMPTMGSRALASTLIALNLAQWLRDTAKDFFGLITEDFARKRHA